MHIKYGFLLCAILIFPIYLLNAKHVIGASDVLPPCDPIFSIGELDKLPFEFSGLSFGNVQEVEIDADGMVDPNMIPRRLIHPDGPYSPDRSDSARELLINFKITHEQNSIFLRLARSGDPDTLVKIDDSREYRVSADMLGSGEGGNYGVYDLPIGALERGNHTISLTIPDNGVGTDGSYSWDAVILCKE